MKQKQYCRSVSEPNLSMTILVQILDLFGTVAFARTDLYYYIGVAGGVIRNITFEKFPRTAV